MRCPASLSGFCREYGTGAVRLGVDRASSVDSVGTHVNVATRRALVIFERRARFGFTKLLA
jgi:hypothetical protein